MQKVSNYTLKCNFRFDTLLHIMKCDYCNVVYRLPTLTLCKLIKSESLKCNVAILPISDYWKSVDNITL